MKLVSFYRKPISIVVMVTFTILLCFWANQSPAAAAPAAAEKSSTTSMEKGGGDGTGFIEQEETEPVVKKGKKIPWLIIGAVVIVGAAAVYFLVLSKKYTLTVNLGEGCTGTPAATGKYKKNKAVSYNFTTQSGYSNLQVKLDGATVPASGTVTMDKDHSLAATATHGAVVNITSTPGGAKIFDNGVDTGMVTPTSLTYTAAGSHVYLLRQCGYQDYNSTQNVVVGQTYNISASLLSGILDNFLTASPCWAPNIASDWTVAGNVYKAISNVKFWSYSYYNTVFSSSTYTTEVKMKRVKGFETNSNSIILSTGTSMSSVNGYLFNYSVNGSYSIWKLAGWNLVTDAATSETAIKGWTASPKISTHLGDWNTLKVVHSGSNYSFYINGGLVNSFSDSTYDPRVLVLAFYCQDNLTELQFDYVKLNFGTTLGLMPAEPASAIQVTDQKPSGTK